MSEEFEFIKQEEELQIIEQLEAPEVKEEQKVRSADLKDEEDLEESTLCFEIVELNGCDNQPVTSTVKKFQCQICGNVFKTPITLKVHMEVHESFFEKNVDLKKVADLKAAVAKKRVKAASQCQVCSKTLSSKCKLDRHVKTIHPEIIENSPNECYFCGQKFITRSSLTVHLTRKHYAGKTEHIKCDFCGKIWKSKMSFYMHVRTHLATVQCELCGAEVKPLSMYSHMKLSHVTDREFSCKICSKSFKALQTLKIHEKRHDKQFECDACGRRYIDNYQLNKHRKFYHENPDSFSCDLCGKRFHQKRNLKTHQNTHDKNRPRPYQCQKCDYATDKKDHLEHHQRSHLRLEERIAAMKNPLKCSLCPTFCRNKYALRFHMKSVHPIELFQCDYCEKLVKTKASLVRHLEIHFKCFLLKSVKM